jgi:hypothetical protein
MDAVGLVHRYDGRPLPDGSTTWTRPSAIDAVLRRVAANRYAAGRLPSREEAAAILDREYFSVEPWPFASLFA